MATNSFVISPALRMALEGEWGSVDDPEDEETSPADVEESFDEFDDADEDE